MDPHSDRPSLRNLPYEVLQRILDIGLDLDDVRSLRLVCRALEYGATTSHYHTVSVSRLLQRDLDKFLGIAASHLAGEVRVIVWHELAEYEYL